jgi:hypothetical protein
MAQLNLECRPPSAVAPVIAEDLFSHLVNLKCLCIDRVVFMHSDDIFCLVRGLGSKLKVLRIHGCLYYSIGLRDASDDRETLPVLEEFETDEIHHIPWIAQTRAVRSLRRLKAMLMWMKEDLPLVKSLLVQDEARLTHLDLGLKAEPYAHPGVSMAGSCSLSPI